MEATRRPAANRGDDPADGLPEETEDDEARLPVNAGYRYPSATSPSRKQAVSLDYLRSLIKLRTGQVYSTKVQGGPSRTSGRPTATSAICISRVHAYRKPRPQEPKRLT